MQYRPLGSSGLRISTLVLGSDNFTNPTPADESERIIATALDAGVNVKGSPNENFARELMELFILGVGNYSEADVQASSAAWTFASSARDSPPNRPMRRHRPMAAMSKTSMGKLRSTCAACGR